MILLIDNYDSFVYNLARYVSELGFARHVVRNDALSVAEVLDMKPQAIILSPGPATPDTAGTSLDLLRAAPGHLPILGVCLGHQSIAQAFGGHVRKSARPMHGRTASIRHDGSALYDGLPNPFPAARYHSLSVDLDPAGPLRATSFADDGEIMGLIHTARPVAGMQFHPESVLTEGGHRLIENFLTRIARIEMPCLSG